MRSRTAFASLTQPARAARCCSSARGMRAVATTAPAPGSTSAMLLPLEPALRDEERALGVVERRGVDGVDRRIEVGGDRKLGDELAAGGRRAQRASSARRCSPSGARDRRASSAAQSRRRPWGTLARVLGGGGSAVRAHAGHHLVEEGAEREHVDAAVERRCGLALRAARATARARPCSPDSRAMPKLTILTAWCSPWTTSPTLRACSAPCTTPSACAAVSAAAISSAIGSASSSESRPRALEHRLQRAPGHPLDDEEGAPVGELAELEDLGDVRVTQPVERRQVAPDARAARQSRRPTAATPAAPPAGR